MQDWIIQLRRDLPDLALITHSQSPETLLRRVQDGVLDLAFLLDPPPIEVLHTQEVAKLRLVLVSNRPGLTPEAATAEGYLYARLRQPYECGNDGSLCREPRGPQAHFNLR